MKIINKTGLKKNCPYQAMQLNLNLTRSYFQFQYVYYLVLIFLNSIKMKKAILLLFNTLLLSTFDISNAQNLVPNPGFENYFSCPVETAELYRCQDWSSFAF